MLERPKRAPHLLNAPLHFHARFVLGLQFRVDAGQLRRKRPQYVPALAVRKFTTGSIFRAPQLLDLGKSLTNSPHLILELSKQVQLVHNENLRLLLEGMEMVRVHMCGIVSPTTSSPRKSSHTESLHLKQTNRETGRCFALPTIASTTNRVWRRFSLRRWS